jgi:hypothetical protein
MGGATRANPCAFAPAFAFNGSIGKNEYPRCSVIT